MKTAFVEGPFFRVADPSWNEPLDATFAQKAGGRWNPPDSHPTLYLNADIETARANVRAKFEDLPYGPEDLISADAPELVTVRMPRSEVCEIRNGPGLEAVGLPVTYPLDDAGALITWSRCRPIGVQADSAGLDGLVCRSAVISGGEELAYYPRRERASPRQLDRRPFTVWYWHFRS